MLQTSQPGLLRRSSRLKTKNEALQQEVLKWQNKVEKMEVQVKNLKKKFGKKNRKKMLTILFVATWTTLSVSM